MIAVDSASIRDRVAESGRIEYEDVSALRKAFFADGSITEDEANRLFDIDNDVTRPSADWSAFFVEALTDYLVRQVRPSGYIDEAKAHWLMQRIDADGHVRSSTELELLVKLIESAHSAPSNLVAYALSAVKVAVIEGSGPTRGGRLVPGLITDAETALVRRILHAGGGEEGAAVSRAEAEMLFEIDDALVGANHDPSWAKLFAQAIGNHLLAAATLRMPDHAAAVKRQEWLDAPTEGVGGFLDRFIHGITKVGNFVETRVGENPVERAYRELNDRRTASAGAAAALTDAECGWVADRIGRNSDISPAETALLRFLKAEAATLPKNFSRLIDRLDPAA